MLFIGFRTMKKTKEKRLFLHHSDHPRMNFSKIFDMYEFESNRKLEDGINKVEKR